TTIMAAERGMSVDLAGYERLMEEAREKARAGGRQGASAVYDLPPAALAEIEKLGHARTDDRAKFEAAPISARIVAIWNGSNLDPSVDTAEDQEVALVLDRTNHYAEMGGQVGDRGTIATSGANFDVQTTRIIGQTILHIGQITHGTLRVGDAVTVTVSTLRKPTQQHHTATHLANWALREVLGDAVQQKGSLVDPAKLRFDFSHGKSLSDDELARVESLTSGQIAAKLPVYAQEAPQEQALKINGLRAVFGEKYPPMVRVVSIGPTVDELIRTPDKPEWRKHSIEFCGGTHVANTADIGSFVITSEESVSKGIRRIVALAGNAATAALEATKSLDAEIDNARAADPSALPALINALQKQAGSDTLPLRAKRRAQQAIAELQAKHKAFEKQQKQAGAGSIDAGQVASDLIAQAGGGAIVANINGITDDQLRSVMDSIKSRLPSHAALLTTTSDGKVSIVAIVSDDLVKKGLKAGDWVRDVAKACGGGGGGRPNMAQAGGKDPTKLEEALTLARATAAKLLTS
ncbi:MAG TPA: alanine--tRNA ligase-related protein, partial [Tepidisphaeraceae bacterium]|nr:alanine--tRNA ligase-related protein [Tepidisphaeraceae bacterium]